jgi:hypothetical protein
MEETNTGVETVIGNVLIALQAVTDVPKTFILVNKNYAFVVCLNY